MPLLLFQYAFSLLKLFCLYSKWLLVQVDALQSSISHFYAFVNMTKAKLGVQLQKLLASQPTPISLDKDTPHCQRKPSPACAVSSVNAAPFVDVVKEQEEQAEYENINEEQAEHNDMDVVAFDYDNLDNEDQHDEEEDVADHNSTAVLQGTM